MKQQHGWLASAVVLFCTTATAAGQYEQPYGRVESGSRMQTQKHEPAAITKIDGKSTRDVRRSDPLAPGKHVVTVRFSSARTVVAEQSQTIEVDVQPCKRYLIAASYESKVHGHWTPVVQAVEDIGECTRKFKLG